MERSYYQSTDIRPTGAWYAVTLETLADTFKVEYRAEVRCRHAVGKLRRPLAHLEVY